MCINKWFILGILLYIGSLVLWLIVLKKLKLVKHILFRQWDLYLHQPLHSFFTRNHQYSKNNWVNVYCCRYYFYLKELICMRIISSKFKTFVSEFDLFKNISNSYFLLFFFLYFTLGCYISYQNVVTSNIYFGADNYRAFWDLTDIFGNHYRIKVHPLFYCSHNQLYF